jgi:threonine synthase
MTSGQSLTAGTVTDLICTGCGAATADPWEWGCSTCGPGARREVRYAEDAVHRMRDRLAERPFDMWRYAELLPVKPPVPHSPLAVGGTAVIEAPALARHIGVARVYIKDDGRNTSGSLKDRATAIGVSMALATGRRAIACASTGNAAASTATLAAAAGLCAVVLIPAHTAAGKLAQLRACGAVICRVSGASYDDVWDLCSELSDRAGWLNRNCAVNPYLVEGKKTAALEFAEQLGAEIPDWVAVGVGDGCTIAGIGRGLVEAHAAGLIPRLPRLLGVQPEGVQPLVRAFHEGAAPYTDTPHSLADGLNVGRPRNATKALRAVRGLGGTLVAVSDAAIIDAIGWTARNSGVLSEPAAAAAFAGVAAAREAGIITSAESVCVVNTGTGLKDPSAVDRIRSLAEPLEISRDAAEALATIARAPGYLSV